MLEILMPLLSRGDLKTPLPGPREIRDHVIRQLARTEDLQETDI